MNFLIISEQQWMGSVNHHSREPFKFATKTNPDPTKIIKPYTILSKVEGPMGIPPWSRGPLLHRGEKRQLSPLVEHGDSSPVFDINLIKKTGK